LKNIIGTKIGHHLNNELISVVKKLGIKGNIYVSTNLRNMYNPANTNNAIISGDKSVDAKFIFYIINNNYYRMDLDLNIFTYYIEYFLPYFFQHLVVILDLTDAFKSKAFEVSAPYGSDQLVFLVNIFYNLQSFTLIIGQIHDIKILHNYIVVII
jgi:hypothetical protein